MSTEITQVIRKNHQKPLIYSLSKHYSLTDNALQRGMSNLNGTKKGLRKTRKPLNNSRRQPNTLIRNDLKLQNYFKMPITYNNDISTIRQGYRLVALNRLPTPDHLARIIDNPHRHWTRQLNMK